MSEEQIRSYIINKDSYDKNILVEAGAGAGKTRLIIQRVIGQIGAGIPVEKIVLITFSPTLLQTSFMRGYRQGLRRISQNAAVRKRNCMRTLL